MKIINKYKTIKGLESLDISDWYICDDSIVSGLTYSGCNSFEQLNEKNFNEKKKNLKPTDTLFIASSQYLNSYQTSKLKTKQESITQLQKTNAEKGFITSATGLKPADSRSRSKYYDGFAKKAPFK